MIYMKHWVYVRQRDLKIWTTHLLTLEGDKDRSQWLNETVTWIPKCRTSFTFEFLPLSLSNPMALKQGWFLPLPSGGGQFLPMSGAIFSHHTQRMLLASCWWSQGYHLISYDTKNSLHNKELSSPKWLDGITDSMHVSLSELGSGWWTGRPGVLRFMGSQSRTWLSDWTELNWPLPLNFLGYFF